MEQEQSSRCSLEGLCKTMSQSIEKEISVYDIQVSDNPNGLIVMLKNYRVQGHYRCLNNKNVKHAIESLPYLVLRLLTEHNPCTLQQNNGQIHG